MFWFIIYLFGFFNILKLHSFVKIKNDHYKNENMIVENTREMFMIDEKNKIKLPRVLKLT